MGKSNHFKRFRKVKSDEQRSSIIAEWVHETMHRLPKAITEDCSPYMEKAYQDSQKFTGRPIEGEWKLHKDWFKVLTANSERSEIFFEVLGWDYEAHHNVSYTETTSIIDVGHGCRLLVVSSGHFPESTIWENKRSGKQWKILCSDIGDGVVEFEPYGDNEARLNMRRSAGSINKFMKRVK